jgi:hypothetical protein
VETLAVFEEAVELEYPIVLLEPLAFLLNCLLEQICARLASRALNTQELRLTLELQNLTGGDHRLDASKIFGWSLAIRRAIRLKAHRGSSILFPGGKINFAELSVFLFPCWIQNFFSNCCNWI